MKTSSKLIGALTLASLMPIGAKATFIGDGPNSIIVRNGSDSLIARCPVYSWDGGNERKLIIIDGREYNLRSPDHPDFFNEETQEFFREDTIYTTSGKLVSVYNANSSGAGITLERLLTPQETPRLPNNEITITSNATDTVINGHTYRVGINGSAQITSLYVDGEVKETH